MYRANVIGSHHFYPYRAMIIGTDHLSREGVYLLNRDHVILVELLVALRKYKVGLSINYLAGWNF